MTYLASKYNLCVLEVPQDFKITQGEAYTKLLEKKFKEIGSSEEFSHGFVNIEDMFKDFSMEDSVAVNSLIGGYRFDKKRVPAPLIKKLFIEKLQERSKDYGVVLTKKDKKMLKEECKAQLLMKTLPTPSLVSWIWDIDNFRVYLDSKSKAVVDKFIELFSDTFNISLVQKNYGIDEDSISDFLEYLWKNAEDEENDSFWINHEVTLDSQKNTFKFNGPSIEEYLEEINNFKSSKKIKNINIGMAMKGDEYSLTFNGKNMIVSVENMAKIKHEDVETAIIDNSDRINTIIMHLEDMAKNYLE